MVEDWQWGGFGLYVHWPFCQSKCPYCDFNSHVSQSVDQAVWREAYLDELARTSAPTSGRTLRSIYFGGGTPSLMDPETVAAILEAARSDWTFANDIEITLEANPGSVEAGRFHGYRDAGVNRVSLGIQALNDRDLRALGRLHTVAEARAAFDLASNTFDRVSFDLICARQDQTLQDWRNELTEALSMAVDHLSLYQLTIEPGTAFGDRYRAGRLTGLPDDDLGADMYFATQELCEKHGLPAYEISNHARPGAESRHNLIYWTYGDYLGIGPGAQGRITIDGQRYATESHLAPNVWLDAVQAAGGHSLFQPLDPDHQAQEYLLMSLRTTQGFDLKRFSSISTAEIDPSRIERLIDLGMLSQTGSNLIATAKGRPILNTVIAELLPD